MTRRRRKAADPRRTARGGLGAGPAQRHPPAEDAVRMRSPAWLLRGISSIPGELILRNGILSFVGRDTGSAWPWQLRKLERELDAPGSAARIDDGRPTTLFSEPVASLGWRVPWYTFRGGLNLRVRGRWLRFSLGRPANTRLDHRSPLPGMAAAGAAAQLAEIGVMRGRGRHWIRALTAAKGPPAPADREQPEEG